MSASSPEASPYKSVAEELEHLRKIFRSLNQRYTARVEAEITQLRDKIMAADTKPAESAGSGAVGSADKPAGKRPAKAHSGGVTERQVGEFHDLRDMLTLLRTFEVDSGVAKRRDFKRVENVLEELRLLARQWT